MLAAVVEGYESEREREKRVSREQKEAARAAKLARREAFDAVREAVPGAFKRLNTTSPECMIEVMVWRFWRRKPVLKRCVPGWFIGTAVFRWAEDRSESYGGTRMGYAIGNDGRLYMGSNGVGDRQEFKTQVPEFRFGLLEQLTGEALQELLKRLEGAGAQGDLPR